jgi:UDP-N-acetyl-2-amino-2-deoxyglucuronate dehydrogenase
MSDFRVGVVGCGGIAQVHGAVLQHLEGVELVACADIRPERAAAFAEKYGGKAYDSMEAMLEGEQLDAVHLCTPHYLHTPMVKLAVERGLHVFTEKPPVINWEQWGQLQELAKGPVRVGVCFQNRYNRSVGMLRDILASGKAGKTLGARAFVTWHREAPYYTESGWRGSLKTEGGGALINQSVHTLDLLGQFLGRANRVEAVMANHHLKGVIEVEDMMEAYIQFGEANALFYATTAHCADSPVLVELVCENVTIRMEEQEVTLTWADGTKEHHSLAAPTTAAGGKAYWGASHGLCIEDFYRCVREEKPFRNDIPGIKDTAELLLSVYQSAREHKVVEL